MINLDELDYEDLLALRDEVNQEISDREFIRNVEQEANNLTVRWHQTQTRKLEEGEEPKWNPPTGAHDSYPIGWPVVKHNGKKWRSLIAGNIHEPGVSGWREVVADGEYASWVQPAGAHYAYGLEDTVVHNGKTWQSTHEKNVWEPPEQWEEIVEEEPEPPIEDPVEPPVDPDPEPGYPAWKPWDHIAPLYQVGQRVTHNGRSWEATAGNNHWEPGVYGWKDLGSSG